MSFRQLIRTVLRLVPSIATGGVSTTKPEKKTVPLISPTLPPLFSSKAMI
jgi:hypothetical protein